MYFFVILLLIVTVSCESYPLKAQDSTVGVVLQKPDHARNHLFWMPTGITSTRGKFSIGLYELFATQIGYTPTKYLQLNGAFSSFVAGYSNWSVGAKVQILQSDESIVQGLAVGSDFGVLPRIGRSFIDNDRMIQTVTVAATLGSHSKQIHLSTVFIDIHNTRRYVQLYQLGGSIELKSMADSRGVKLMTELSYISSNPGTVSFISGIIGFRTYGSVFVADLGGVYFPNRHPTYISGLRNSLYPYFSVMWYF